MSDSAGYAVPPCLESVADRKIKRLRAELTRVTAERDWAYGAFKRLAINVCEMDSDHKNGDFDLPELARLDLNACLECCSELPEAFQNWTKTKVATRAELLAELAEARPDAERYRTVRDLMMHEHRADAAGWTLSVLLPGDDPDAAIDAARSES